MAQQTDIWRKMFVFDPKCGMYGPFLFYHTVKIVYRKRPSYMYRLEITVLVSCVLNSNN